MDLWTNLCLKCWFCSTDCEPNMKKKVCVLMSTYNGQKYVEEQLLSILAQKLDCELSIKIRDDGSSDDTCKIIEKIQIQYPNKIELFKEKHVGFNSSFFKLLQNAKGFDYYAFSDQDDYWLPDKLQTAIEALEKENSDLPLMYASTSYLVDEHLKPYGLTRKQLKPITIFNSVIQDICPGHNEVFNNRFLDVAKGQNIDVNKIYTYDSWLQNVAVFKGKLIFDNNPHCYYRQHGKNAFGYGKHAIGQLFKSLRRAVCGEGKKYRNEVEYFVEVNKIELEKQNILQELTSFINAKTIHAKLKYLIRSKLYRQSKLETIAFYVAVLFGKF